jgi:hypothetical protein
MPPGRDPARHDGQDRIAARTRVAPADDDDPRRLAVRVGGPAELALANPVTVQPKRTTYRSTGSLTNHACPWSGALRRRRGCEPPLDVECVMNDV